jgi:hypothetical protein
MSESNYFQALLDVVPIATYCTDAAGYVTYFNPAAVEFSGRVPRLGVDRWCVTWKLFHGDGSPMPHDQCPMAMALKEGRAVLGRYALAERPDGSRVRFTPYPMPFHDPEGKLVGGMNMLFNPEDHGNEERMTTLLSSIAGFFGDHFNLENPTWLIRRAFGETVADHSSLGSSGRRRMSAPTRVNRDASSGCCAACGLPIAEDERPKVQFHESCYQRTRVNHEADAWSAFNQLNRPAPKNSPLSKKRNKTKDRTM